MIPLESFGLLRKDHEYTTAMDAHLSFIEHIRVLASVYPPARLSQHDGLEDKVTRFFKPKWPLTCWIEHIPHCTAGQRDFALDEVREAISGL